MGGMRVLQIFQKAADTIVKAVGIGAIAGFAMGEPETGAKVGGVLGVGVLLSALGEREKRKSASLIKGPDIA